MVHQTASAAPVSAKRKIPWKDCECGCSGNTFKVGSLIYWMCSLPPHTGRLELRRDGHGTTGKYVRTFDDLQSMDDFVLRQAKPILERERDRINEVLALC